jgi:hypothetical protein
LIERQAIDGAGQADIPLTSPPVQNVAKASREFRGARAIRPESIYPTESEEIEE